MKPILEFDPSVLEDLSPLLWEAVRQKVWVAFPTRTSLSSNWLAICVYFKFIIGDWVASCFAYRSFRLQVNLT